MPNLPKQPGDPVLKKDGTVVLNGKVVGVWERTYWMEADMWFYGFSLEKGEERVVSEMFKHLFKERIAEYFGRPQKVEPRWSLP